VDRTIRIGELARRTGVSPELLRAWEDRYGLLKPSRSPGGFRLYTAADEARARRMTRLIADGLSAAEAAQQALTVDEANAAVAAPIVDQLAEQLRAALDDFDGTAAHSAFDSCSPRSPQRSCSWTSSSPTYAIWANEWAAGRASVAQEHFASHLIRGRLLAIARDWDTGDGPTLLLACLPGEAHDIGLIIFGILAPRRGWRITLLGSDTPLDTLYATVRTMRPSLTVLLATTPSLLTTHSDELDRRLTARPRVPSTTAN
jgi:MerR family transcriptional regulator, light-induced transcriptional regulator